MRFAEPLDDLLQSRSYVRILRALHGVPEGVDVSTREIARRAGVTHPTAAGVLEQLRRQGIVRVRRTVWADEYRVNPEHELWRQVRPLFRWERRLHKDLLAFLATEIGERTPWVTAAYLFGSAARDDMQPDSDIDVAVICPKNRAASTKKGMESLAEGTAERFGNRLSAVVGTRPIAELSERGQPGYRLWRTIAKEGIRLIPADEDRSL